MSTPEEIRRERLRSDELEMRRLHRDVIRVTASGEPPESYRLHIRVRSILGPGPTYRGEHEVEVALPAGYPFSPPNIRMLTLPPPFHPNWFRSGQWCGGDWTGEERLGRHVWRMIKTLQFEPSFTNPDSPANAVASEWFQRNRGCGLFPCDRSLLPDPELQVILEPPRLQLLPEGDQT